jgi:Glycosyl hydrolases family 28
VENCTVRTEDDALCLKSGLDLAGLQYNLSSHNSTVRNNVFQSRHGAGLCIGSELSGSVRNATFADNAIVGSRYGVRIKTARGRGGVVEDIRFVRNAFVASDAAAAAPQQQQPQQQQQEPQQTQPVIVITAYGGNRRKWWRGYHWSDRTQVRNVQFEQNSLDESSRIRGISIQGLGSDGGGPYLRGGGGGGGDSSSSSFHDIDFVGISLDDATTAAKDANTSTSTTRFTCSNAAHIRINGAEFPCTHNPYYFVSYGMDQVQHKVGSVFRNWYTTTFQPVYNSVVDSMLPQAELVDHSAVVELRTEN